MSFKFSLIAIIFIFATQNMQAQYRLVGTIKDAESHESLSGATVYVTDLKTGVVADVEGNYALDNLKIGNYLLEISLVGYKTIIERVAVSQDANVDFLLAAASKELTEVVVTGVTRSTELKQSPIIIKTIDANTLNQSSSTNLIDALREVPGVSQITTGAAISKPVIRGLGYNRVVSLYNGIRQEGQQWGDEHGIEIDEYAIDRIEIVKCPGSLLYGSDAIAGVLNFISPKAPTLGSIKTQLISNYQTNNNLIGYSLSNAGNKNGVQWLARLSQKQAGNYTNKYDGKVYNSGFRELNGSAFVGINKNWGYTHLHLNTFNTTLNLIEGDRDSTGKFAYISADGTEKTATTSDLRGYTIGFPHQAISHLRVLANNYFILKHGTMNVDLGFQNNKRKEFGDVANPNNAALFFDLTTFNYNARYNFETLHGWETAVGVGGMWQTNVNGGLAFLIPAYRLFDIGGFVFTQKTFAKKLTIAGGLRFDNRNMTVQPLFLAANGKPTTVQDSTTTLKFNGFNNDYNGISGSLGASYQLTTTSTLKLNLSRGFRSPNIAELAANGRHEGTFKYEYGAKNLHSETSHQIDLAYFLNTDHFSFELTPFANFIDQYIYAKKLVNTLGKDSIPDPADPAPAYQFAQANATLLGGELYIDVHPHPLDWLHIENSLSYVQATQAHQPDSTRYLPFIPAAKYSGELKAEFKTAGKQFTNAYLKFGVDHYFAQNQFFAAYGTETATPAYTLLSAGAGATVKAFNRKDFLQLFISTENLTDVAYQNHLSRLKYAPQNVVTGRNGVYNMGRNVSVKAIFNW